MKAFRCSEFGDSAAGSYQPFAQIDQNREGHRAQARLLLADDDPFERQRIAKYLTQHDMRISESFGCEIVMRQVATGGFSLVILDQQLDSEVGLLRKIRAQSDVPVILTAAHPCEADLVAALELGADDYMAKPIFLRELLARVRALLRHRKADHRAPKRDLERGRYRFGGWQLDRRTRRLINSDGVRVMLTKVEYTLLLAFLDAPHRPLTRDYLKQATRIHRDIADKSIDSQVRRLRHKLESGPKLQRIIQTQQGVGYFLALRVVRL
ncbi:MAG: response regulator [Dongiaceae bacterium]